MVSLGAKESIDRREWTIYLFIWLYSCKSLCDVLTDEKDKCVTLYALHPMPQPHTHPTKARKMHNSVFLQQHIANKSKYKETLT